MAKVASRIANGIAMKRLSTAQRKALEWLATAGPWTAPWWGGKPHAGWPVEMKPRTFDALHRAALIKVYAAGWADRTVEITDKGRAAIFTIGVSCPKS